MLRLLNLLIKNLPTLILSFLLAVAVWISAVTSADPTEEQQYPRQIKIELVGKDPALIITNNYQEQVVINLSAPRSIWSNLINDSNKVRALVDLSGLGKGEYDAPIHVQIGLRPVEVISYSPETIKIVLETMATKEIPVHLIQRGEPALGFQAGTPVLSQSTVNISGPETQVAKVKKIQATLDLTDVSENITRNLVLKAIDANEQEIQSITITPNRVQVTEAITQKGGYRNVVVKVTTKGQLASGFRLTSISASPAAVTLFSTDPENVDKLPSFIETEPVDMTGIKDDLDLKVSLQLPQNIIVIGEQTVQVQVGIAAIESSVTLTNMRVETIGLLPEQQAKISPENVDVILSGPLPILDKLNRRDVRVVIDLNGISAGTYKRAPIVEMKIQDIRVESILPGTIEILVIDKTPTVTAPPPSETPTISLPAISETPTPSVPTEVVAQPEEPTVTLTPSSPPAPEIILTPTSY